LHLLDLLILLSKFKLNLGLDLFLDEALTSFLRLRLVQLDVAR